MVSFCFINSQPVADYRGNSWPTITEAARCELIQVNASSHPVSTFELIRIKTGVIVPWDRMSA